MQLEEHVYEGRVHHARSSEIDHRFTYRVWWSLARLGCSKLPKIVRPRADRYMDAAEVRRRLRVSDDTEVFLLTQPSLVGRSFNPVSFYFVTQQGALQGIIAHITNTPWDEQHCYVLQARGDATWVFDKAFHVSPFMPMALEYRWRFRLRGDRILITMQLLDRGHKIFVAMLNLKPVAPSRWLGVRLRMQYPLQNAATLWRIYWQALRLKLKGAQYHAHPNHSGAAPSGSPRSAESGTR